jgi:hypothetical protein
LAISLGALKYSAYLPENQAKNLVIALLLTGENILAYLSCLKPKIHKKAEKQKTCQAVWEHEYIHKHN